MHYISCSSILEKLNYFFPLEALFTKLGLEKREEGDGGRGILLSGIKRPRIHTV
jgi:hypothetical protein